MTSPALDSFPNKRPRLASYDHKHYRPHPSPPSYTSPRSPPPQHQHQHQHHQQPQQHQHPPYQPHYPQSYSYQQAPPPLPPPPPPPASAPPQYPPPSAAPPHGAHHPAIPPPLPPAESGSRPPPSQHTLPMPLQHRPESGPDSYQYRPPPPTHAYYPPQYATEPMPAHTPTTPSQPPSAADPPSRQYMPPYNGTHRSQSDAPLPSPYQQTDLEMSQAHVQHASGTPLEQQRPPPYPAAAQQQQGPESPAYENGYTYGNSLPAAQSDAQQRRKAVRASQACESCRAKKCKCDEERPRCSNCITTDTQCNYRTLPPPKQERNMIQVIEQIASLGSQMSEMRDYFSSTFVRRDELESLRAGLQATIREEVRGVQMHSKRGSDKSQSPGQHSNFTSPAVLPGQTEPGSARPAGFKNVDGQYQHDQFTYSPANSHRSDPVNSLHSKGTPQQHSNRVVSRQRTDTKGIDDAAVKALDPLEGQLSIPVNHETGAHKLLIAWDAIHPLYNTVIDQEYAKNYVWREETRRGQLRLYGQGEGHDGSSRRKTVPPSLESPLCSEDSNGSGATTADGFWGFSFDGPKARPADDCGGLDHDGSLCVDKDIIIRLFHSFMDNIWVMHPFLNQTELKFTFQKFVARYGRETMSPTSSFSAKSEFPPGSKFEDNTKFKGPKRVRPDEHGDESAAPSKVPRSPGNSRTGPLERSISNAVILLILALGKICEHKDPIPPPVSGDTAQQDLLSPLDLGQATTNGMSRTASTDSQFIPPPKPVRHVRNIDKLPGLAYYAYAIGILGEQQGAPDLAHVHAKILAGLYMGQMARVIDSWSWIHSACISLQLIFGDEKELEDGPAERGDAIKFAFWTCSQLESDIIAELSELPHSGISRQEDRMPLPRWSTVDYAPDAPETMIMIYYSAQINLRKILNRAHSALYSSGKEPLKNPGWTILCADDLAEQLQDWRRGLPPPFAWSDNDEPPSDINATRLRAKYYGAEYIIHRPFLHHLLQDEHGKASLENGKISTLKTKERHGIVDMARHCIDSAVKSTIAFDGLIGRPIVTNIFGTAHAQFGNILVLAACRTSKRYGWFVQPQLLNYLIERTIRFVGNIAPLAPTMRTNLEILRNVTNMVALVPDDRFSGNEGGEMGVGVGEGARDGSLGGGGAGSVGNEGGEAGSDRMSIASGTGNGAGTAAAAAGAPTVAGAATGGSFSSNGGMN